MPSESPLAPWFSSLRWLATGGAVILVAFLSACVNPRAANVGVPAPPAVVQSTVRFRKEYVITPGDHLEVTVRRSPEVSRTVVVRPDGFITIPIANDVAAAGLTPMQLKDKLTSLLAQRLLNPEVTVIATQVKPAMVYVVGDVNAPQAVPLSNASTALQAIGLAGGFKRSAADRAVAVIRLSEDGFVRALPVDVTVKGQPGPYMAARAVPLMADDIIFVPENGRSQFTRALDDFVNRPLGGLSAVVSTYVNFRLIALLN
jgi:polysaccharide export outer membrane protein